MPAKRRPKPSPPATTWLAYCPRCERTIGAERTWAGWCVACLRAWQEALRRMPREEGETC